MMPHFPCPRPFAALTVLLLSGAAHAEAQLPEDCAQVFDGQRITIVVPNAAGGGFDLYARALAPVLSEISGASALVSNITGGGGKAAIVRVVSAPPSEMVAFFDSANDTIATLLTDASLNMSITDLEVAGIVHSEPDSWLGRPDIDLSDPAMTSIVSASAMIESNLVPVVLAARSLGIEARVVSGYANSSENVAAILRGEADVSALTLTSALRATESSETRVLMVLDDKPDPRHPDIPWLAGEGGLVAQRSADLPEEERVSRQDMARIVVALSRNPRTVFLPAAMESAAKTCLSAAIGVALTSEAFAEGAKAIKRPVSPVVGADAQEVVAKVAAAYQEARPLLDALLQDLQGQ